MLQQLHLSEQDSQPFARLGDLAAVLVVVTLCLLGMFATPVRAAQTLDVRDGDTTISRISVRDQTRLRVDRGRVLDVIGDVFDAQKSPAGRIAVLKDDVDGEVYLKPVPPASMRGMDGSLPPGPLAGPLPPIKLDVKTDRGTVGLLLQPADVVGDTVTLRINGGEQRRAALASEPRGKSHPHVRGAKALTLAMAAPALAGEIPSQRLPGAGQELALWREARFVLQARFEAPGLVGESYELTNVSGEPMVIDERELFRPGVVSVSVRDLQLPPGASTPVWIVRQAGEDG
ncbi:type-F conjugative transfer system secretin TraK [Rubrivivax sp. A210]|uniref:TraK domain-containing protein n=1 Tax=Rubrivivax sp. A210 TaxID=2772301 RepID=UPI0019181DED|nr:type-F conjugative transfer system secretin TraK [Rubrivivax sp. A210]